MHNISRSTALLALALTLIACGTNSGTVPGTAIGNGSDSGISGSTGNASANGSVDGHSLTANSSAFAAVNDNGNFLVLVLSSQSNYCGAIGQGETHPGHTSFVASLFTVTSQVTSPAVSPGTFTVVSQAPTTAGSYANAEFHSTDQSCNDLVSTTDGTGSGGTITLTSVTSTEVVGTFNVTFGSNTISGSFDSPTCAALGNLAVNGTALTCSPN